jgi:hypothetical protein
MDGDRVKRVLLSTVTVAAALTAVLTLGGCVSNAPSPYAPLPSGSPAPLPANFVAVPEDAVAFAQLAEVAPKSLKLEGGSVVATRCWTPSEHLFTDPTVAPASTWKVLCRVFYDLKGVRRYQDSTCIGDFHKKPMLTHCYVWELYSGVPKFEDGKRLASPAPTPLP